MIPRHMLRAASEAAHKLSLDEADFSPTMGERKALVMEIRMALTAIDPDTEWGVRFTSKHNTGKERTVRYFGAGQKAYEDAVRWHRWSEDEEIVFILDKEWVVFE